MHSRFKNNVIRSPIINFRELLKYLSISISDRDKEDPFFEWQKNQSELQKIQRKSINKTLNLIKKARQENIANRNILYSTDNNNNCTNDNNNCTNNNNNCTNDNNNNSNHNNNNNSNDNNNNSNHNNNNSNDNNNDLSDHPSDQDVMHDMPNISDIQTNNSQIINGQTTQITAISDMDQQFTQSNQTNIHNDNDNIDNNHNNNIEYSNDEDNETDHNLGNDDNYNSASNNDDEETDAVDSEEEALFEVQRKYELNLNNFDDLLDEKLQPKQWHEIQFDKYWPTTKLIRCQYYGSCNAGRQMVNPCAHVSAFFWLIAWVMSGDLDEKLEINKRDKKLLKPSKESNRIIDATKGIEWMKALNQKFQKEQEQLYCKCQLPAHGRYFGPCDCCDMYYHAECLDRDPKIELENEKNGKPFRCDHWHEFYVFERFWGKVEKDRKMYIEYLIWCYKKEQYKIMNRPGKPKMKKCVKQWIKEINSPRKQAPNALMKTYDLEIDANVNINEIPKVRKKLRKKKKIQNNDDNNDFAYDADNDDGDTNMLSILLQLFYINTTILLIILNKKCSYNKKNC